MRLREKAEQSLRNASLLEVILQRPISVGDPEMRCKVLAHFCESALVRNEIVRCPRLWHKVPTRILSGHHWKAKSSGQT